MADQILTPQRLINGDKDLQTIEDFMKIKDETITTRFGDEIMTMSGLQEEVKKSGGYFKRYTSLAAANADIANIPVNGVVKVTDAVDGGDYEKATAGATSLTKSAHDPLTQAKVYTDTNLAYFLPPQPFGYVNITTGGEVDFLKYVYISGSWVEGDVIYDNLAKNADGLSFYTYIRDKNNVILMGGDIAETDYTGVKTYTIPNSTNNVLIGKIQVDWSKYNPLVTGISKNRYVKDKAHFDFTQFNSQYDKEQAEQDERVTAQESNINVLKQDLAYYLAPMTQDYGYYNKTAAGEVDFVKKLYVAGTWTEGYVILDNFAKNAGGFYTYFRNPSNGILAGGNVSETDYTGVKTYTVVNDGNVNVPGFSVKIQVDWSKYNQLGSGISLNRYVKDAAHTDFTVTDSNDVVHENLQDTRLTTIESKAKALTYKRFVNHVITSANFAASGTLWTIANNTAVCVNPSETTKLYTKQEYISNKIKHRWTVSLKADSVVKFGGYVGVSYIETTCVVDCVNKKLIINKVGDNASASATPRVSVSIPFNIVSDREYYVELFRNNRKNSIRLIDAVTGQSIEATDDWSSVAYATGSGNMRSQMYVTLASGTSITVKKYENYLPVGVDVVFGGDSNTESSQDVGGVYQVNWADNLLTDVFNENGVKFAKFGIAFAAWFACINEVIAIKPKYFIVNIGTNGATTQAQYQQIVDVCATNNIELILCHNPRDDGSRTYLAQNNLNIDAVNVQTVKFDVATSLNNDLAQAYNSAYYKDGVHLNAVGYKAMSDRFLAEIPMLKSS